MNLTKKQQKALDSMDRGAVFKYQHGRNAYPFCHRTWEGSNLRTLDSLAARGLCSKIWTGELWLWTKEAVAR